MDLQALTGITSAGVPQKRDLPDAAGKNAVVADNQPSVGRMAASSTQVVDASPEAAKAGIDKRGEEQAQSRDDVEGAVGEINEFFQSTQRSLQFSIDEESEKLVIQIKDQDGKVLKQIPPESALELARRLDEVKGLLFEEQA